MSNRAIARADLAEAIYNQLGLSRSRSATLVEQVLGEITDALVAGKTVKDSSFGSFGFPSERVGRNPKTGVEVPITPRKVLVFKASHVLKDSMNGIAPSELILKTTSLQMTDISIATKADSRFPHHQRSC